MCIVAGPRFESLEPSLTCQPLRFLQQCGRDSPALMVGMSCQVPDHPAAAGPVVETVAFALEVEKPYKLALVFGDELDRRTFVMLLLSLDGIEKRRIEERQETTAQPTDLVRWLIRSDHEAHGASLARRASGIKSCAQWPMPPLSLSRPVGSRANARYSGLTGVPRVRLRSHPSNLIRVIPAKGGS